MSMDMDVHMNMDTGMLWHGHSKIRINNIWHNVWLCSLQPDSEVRYQAQSETDWMPTSTGCIQCYWMHMSNAHGRTQYTLCCQMFPMLPDVLNAPGCTQCTRMYSVHPDISRPASDTLACVWYLSLPMRHHPSLPIIQSPAYGYCTVIICIYDLPTTYIQAYMWWL